MTSAADAALKEFLVPFPGEKCTTEGESGAVSVAPSTTPARNASSGEASAQVEVANSERPPESPDMKFARTRLGHLLSGIRSGEIQAGLAPSRAGKRASPTDFDEGLSRSLNRPKKLLRRERRVVFELRGKPFGLRDSGHEEAVFSLCRTWMRGKEEEPAKTESAPPEAPQPTDDCLDLLATKEILALPRAREGVEAVSAVPPTQSKAPSPEDLNLADPDALLADFLPHTSLSKYSRPVFELAEARPGILEPWFKIICLISR